MKVRTLLSLMCGGRFTLLLSTMRAARACHRVAFLGAGVSSGLQGKLRAGPVPLAALAADADVASSLRDGLEAWLQLGVALGELRSGPAGYSLRGRRSRALLEPANDDATAWIEEVAFLDNVFITQTPARLRPARRFTLADQDARMVARGSRLAEPFIAEALQETVPRRGPVRLFEIGCGSAAHIRNAAALNPELTALGLELQPEAAALAAENVSRWNLAARVAIEVGDVRQRSPEPVFDLATLHQNIFYFPVDHRVGLLRHVRGFLKLGGRLLLTTPCQGGGAAIAVLNLWAAMTEGCGRLPAVEEMTAQLAEAGFRDLTRRNLIPGESLHAFVGTNGGDQEQTR